MYEIMYIIFIHIEAHNTYLFFQKYGITQKRSDIDNAITNKMNSLYKDAISKFQDDIRFWIAYMKFCKHVVSNKISRCLSFLY